VRPDRHLGHPERAARDLVIDHVQPVGDHRSAADASEEGVRGRHLAAEIRPRFARREIGDSRTSSRSRRCRSCRRREAGRIRACPAARSPGAPRNGKPYSGWTVSGLMNTLNTRGIVPTARRPTSIAPKRKTAEKASASTRRPRTVSAPMLDRTLGSSTSIRDDTSKKQQTEASLQERCGTGRGCRSS